MPGQLPSRPMRKPTRTRELGRGERVLPGVWRLRLPLPWPGVPHCNAWAIAAGDGIVLVDTGMHEPGSLGAARARARPGRPAGRAHPAARLHPRPHRPLRPGAPDRRPRRLRAVDAPQPRAHHRATPTIPRRRSRAGSRSRARAACRSEPPQLRGPRAARRGPARARPRPAAGRRDRDRPRHLDGDETPGHAPSHVCLYQPERRLLISGDHLLGRVSLYFDYGCTPDPVGEFLGSLDTVEALDARLALSRPRAPVHRRRRAHRGQPQARAQRLDAVLRRARERAGDRLRARARASTARRSRPRWRAGC